MNKIVKQDPQLINTHLWHLPNLNIMNKYDFQIENNEEENNEEEKDTIDSIIHKCWKLFFY
jgi:hypothetical protein